MRVNGTCYACEQEKPLLPGSAITVVAHVHGGRPCRDRGTIEPGSYTEEYIKSMGGAVWQASNLLEMDL